MGISGRTNFRAAAKALALATLADLVVFELYSQIFVLRAFSSNTDFYIYRDGKYREATAMEQVLDAILSTRFFFGRAVVVAIAVTLLGSIVIALMGRKLSTSVAHISIAGSVVGGAIGLGSLAYFRAWDSNGSFGVLLACVAAGIAAMTMLSTTPNNSLEGDASKATRPSS
jgi:hypothetical protein